MVDNNGEGFALMVHVPAEEWAYAQRRATYLEAVLVQVLRDREMITEWFAADYLARLMLAGMPTSKAGITRLANAQRWRRREMPCQGGRRYEYHFANLPARAFDDLMTRIIGNIDSLMPVEDQMQAETVDNTAPAWVLPLMRLLKRDGDLSAAWRDLPSFIHPSIELPSIEEAAETIRRFGLVQG